MEQEGERGFAAHLAGNAQERAGNKSRREEKSRDGKSREVTEFAPGNT